MNLGQLIGELLMRAEGIEPRSEPAPEVGPTKPRVWGARHEQVLALAKTRSPLTYSDLVDALAINEGLARQILGRLEAKGKLVRVSRGNYALPEPA